MAANHCVESDARRAYIDNIRKQLETIVCKTSNNQEILLERLEYEEHAFARLIIKSGAKNALSGKMIGQLTKCIDELYDWTTTTAAPAPAPAHVVGETPAQCSAAQKRLPLPIKAVLIQGHDETFCSGSDLVSVRATANQEWGLKLAQVMQYNFMRIQQLPIPSVAFIEGYALGGGAELALAADMRLMSERAKIGFVHAKVGVCCGWGGGSRLVELLGPSRALELLLSGRTVGAHEALQMGLVNGIVPVGTNKAGSGCCGGASDNNDDHNENKLNEDVLKFLIQHTVGPQETMRAVKAMVNSARLQTFTQSLEVEGQLFASTWGKEPHIRALDCNMKHNNSSSGGGGKDNNNKKSLNINDDNNSTTGNNNNNSNSNNNKIK